jgi:hypothetical protein
MGSPQPDMPSQVDGEPEFFDRFAGAASSFASRAPFFAFCVALLIVWAPTVTFLKVDTWQLIINTVTTIVTFLLVALLQNSQTRGDQATQHKLNAIADRLADLMVRVAVSLRGSVPPHRDTGAEAGRRARRQGNDLAPFPRRPQLPTEDRFLASPRPASQRGGTRWPSARALRARAGGPLHTP